MADNQQERERFEAAMVEAGFHHPEHSPFDADLYLNARDQDRFFGWQLGRITAIEQAAQKCDEMVTALDNGGNAYTSEASASQCASAIRALKRQSPAAPEHAKQAALQALVDQAQELGLYDNTRNPMIKTEQVAEQREDALSLADRLTRLTIDYNGTAMQDGEEPLSGVTCGLLREAAASLSASAEPVKGEPFAWATFDGEGSYDLRLYENNEGYREAYLSRNGAKYADWVIPLYRDIPPPAMEAAADGRPESAALDGMRRAFSSEAMVRRDERQDALASSPSAAPEGKVPTVGEAMRHVLETGERVRVSAEQLLDGIPRQPRPDGLRMSPAWLRRHLESDPDGDVEAGRGIDATPSQPQEPEAGEREPFSPILADEFVTWLEAHYPTMSGATVVAMGDAWLHGRDTGYAKGKEDARNERKTEAHDIVELFLRDELGAVEADNVSKEQFQFLSRLTARAIAKEAPQEPGELPPLPERWALHCGVRHTPPGTREMWGIIEGESSDTKQDLFTADQMRAYALAARAMQAGSVGEDVDGYARRLATAIFEKHYKADGSPDFALLENTAGVLTQIDNMVTGLSRHVAAVPQPIETAPQDETRILAWSIEYGWRETYWRFYGDGSIAKKMYIEGKGPSGAWEWYEPQSRWIASWKPTHWMPLPAAPTAQEGE